MSRRVTRLRGEALKCATPVLGKCLARRSEVLLKHNVPTPKAQFHARAQAVTMPWIDGRQGYEVLAQENDFEPFLMKVARTITQVHHVPVSSLDLPPFDPWKKILSRLSEPVNDSKAIYAMAGKTAANLQKAYSGDRSRAVTVHGDFHIGQVVFGDDGITWLLDLEDLALGEPESDLANFAAHLTTSRYDPNIDLQNEFTHWSALLASAWSAANDTGANRTLLEWYGAAALLRRALKLNERRRSLKEMTMATRAIEAAHNISLFYKTTDSF